MRKSREASMEGQLNKVDQILYAGDGTANSTSARGANNNNNNNSNNNNNNNDSVAGVFAVSGQQNNATQQTNLKHRLTASAADSHIQNVQHQNASMINGSRYGATNQLGNNYLPTNLAAASYQHPQLMSLSQQQMLSLDGSDSVVGVGPNYGLYNALPNNGNSSSSLDLKVELGEHSGTGKFF